MLPLPKNNQKNFLSLKKFHKYKSLKPTILKSENQALRQAFMYLSRTVSSSVFAIIMRKKSAKVAYLYYKKFLKFVSVITSLNGKRRMTNTRGNKF